MKAGLWVVLAAGAMMSAGAIPVEAQARGTTQRQEAAERERAREQAREARERGRTPVYGTRTNRDDRDDRRNDRDDRRDRDGRYDDRYDDRYESKRNPNGGPAFCRSGEGHPVFGRQWCRDKGFGLGNGRRGDDGYNIWEDVILRQPRTQSGMLRRSVLEQILGPRTLAQFESYGYRFGQAPMTGQWLNQRGGYALQLNLGSLPLATLIDTNRDGRVDDVRLRR